MAKNKLIVKLCATINYMNTSKPTLTAKHLHNFIRSVLESERHFLCEENARFLHELYESSKSRVVEIPTGSIYYRARVNPEFREKPLPKEEMIPVPGLRTEGRVNPYNVNVLYLSNKPEIAVAEVRPGLYDPTTVATFVTKRDLRLVNFATNSPNNRAWTTQLDAKNTVDDEAFTWIEINKCFSTSFTSIESRLNYIPTQIISEFFKYKGYDGVMYQSQFDVSENSSDSLNANVALFNTSLAEATETKLFQIQRQIINVKEIHA